MKFLLFTSLLLITICYAQVQCDSSGASCPSGDTCCKTATGQWGCCPSPNATCCSDHIHCCPHDYPVCDVSQGQCKKSANSFESVSIMVKREYNVAPTGSYCGNYAGMFKLRVDVESSTKLNMTGSVFGTPYSCPNEVWTFDSTDSEVKLPGLTNHDDCLGGILREQGIDPASVTVDYNQPPTNNMVCNTPFGDLTLNSCQ